MTELCGCGKPKGSDGDKCFDCFCFKEAEACAKAAEACAKAPESQSHPDFVFGPDPDLVTIFGIKYHIGIFRGLGLTTPVGHWHRIDAREDGILTLTLEHQERIDAENKSWRCFHCDEVFTVAWVGRESEHHQAVTKAEEDGYGKGVRDMTKELQEIVKMVDGKVPALFLEIFTAAINERLKPAVPWGTKA